MSVVVRDERQPLLRAASKIRCNTFCQGPFARITFEFCDALPPQPHKLD